MFHCGNWKDFFMPPQHSVVWSAHNNRHCVCVTGSFLIPRKMFPEFVKNDNFGRS